MNKNPLSLRISPELFARLEQCAERVKMKKHALAQHAIEAAILAIEQNGYRIVAPIEFRVTQVPVPKPDNDPPAKRFAEPVSSTKVQQAAQAGVAKGLGKKRTAPGA